MRRQNIEKCSGVNRPKNKAREQKRKAGTKSARVQMMPPVEDLLLRIVKIEERFHCAFVPSCEARESAREIENAFGAATLNRTPVETVLDVVKLNGINVDGHYRVMGGQFYRRAASRGDAEDTSARLERTKLNFGVLIHAAE
jgi:hypothetical protein